MIEHKQITVPATGRPLKALDESGHIRFDTRIESGQWVRFNSLFRLLLTGNGTVTLTARNVLGVETVVDTYTPTDATNLIEFPYAGDDAIQIKIDLTGTVAGVIL